MAVRGSMNINLIWIYVATTTTTDKIKLPELDLESSSVINLGIQKFCESIDFIPILATGIDKIK